VAKAEDYGITSLLTVLDTKNLPTTCIIGFDSAWTDQAKAPGAVCAVEIDGDGARRFDPPFLARFDKAAEFIEQKKAQFDKCLVCIDQPTIVPNLAGGRPVEKVAASIISFVGGGVQPASRSRTSMFGDDAPIWRFKKRLAASDDALTAVSATSGLFIAEVFPALALISFGPQFFRRKGAPKYNPINRSKFKIEDWQAVCNAVSKTARHHNIEAAATWSDEARSRTPAKADQDMIDSILCALIGMSWLFGQAEDTVMIGDQFTGFMLAPCSPEILARMKLAATQRNIPLTHSKNVLSMA
jgi:predicted RNase H-like nuclease